MVISKALVVLLPLIMSQLISLLYPMNKEWYGSLNKSPYNPPDYLFAPVWTVLYLTIGWSLMKYPHDWLNANLVLNFAWIIAFNGWKDLKLGSVILVLTVATLVLYLKETQNWLLIPYLIWIIFASYLNIYLVWKN